MILKSYCRNSRLLSDILNTFLFIPLQKSEPEITTFTSNMKNTVDYVFYSAGSLVPVGVLKTIDWAVVDATGGLPSKDFPSDHLSLKAVMAFNK